MVGIFRPRFFGSPPAGMHGSMHADLGAAQRGKGKQIMRLNKIALCAVVALCAMGSSGCMLIGVAAMASAQQPANKAGAADGKQAKPGIGGMAMAAAKSGMVGGPVGAGLVSQGPKLARAMFGRKGPAKRAAAAEATATAEATTPEATTTDAVTADAATASSGSN